MPRGYLKHNHREVGKKARGGNSHYSWTKYSSWTKLSFSDQKRRRGGKYPSVNTEDFEDELSYYDYLPAHHEDNKLARHAVIRTFADYLPQTLLRAANVLFDDIESEIGSDVCEDKTSYVLCLDCSSESISDSYSMLEDHSDILTVPSTDWSVVPPGVEVQDPGKGRECLVDVASYGDISRPDTPSPTHSGSHMTTICPICMKEKTPTELHTLVSSCKHPPACKECLYTHYIQYTMNDLCKFPLRCFWPSCKAYLRDMQVRRFVKTPDDLKAFYQNEAAAKAMRRQRLDYAALQERRIRSLQALELCTFCGHANPVYPGRSTQRMFLCENCNLVGNIVVMSANDVRMLVTASLYAERKKGMMIGNCRTVGDVLVNCPSCCTLIMKNGGCNDIVCVVCLAHFNFQLAKRPMDLGGSQTKTSGLIK